jgi:hypothetical protein
MTDNLDQYEEEIYNQQQADQPFEREEDISKRLLSIEKGKSRAINNNTPIANNNELEMQSTRGAARVINRLEYAEKRLGLNLSDSVEFFEGTRNITETTGRGKNMAVGYLTKSNINIQQQEQMQQAVQEGYEQQAEQGIREKIGNKFSFLKKKEM